ncbi:Nramp family divalent metal transporter [Aurantibacillus circumpalustris]|uniref:Nramp family divalent metal transporter n=1 Tax=Aurantibacillus circumpalustris TaxID=3036359 RepID=UPI00295B3DF4|nr:Nramp family divalent metal transporter [Aurantibacillus circumpalustris]
MNKSLEEVNSSVSTQKTSSFRRLLAFFGPAYMISVGYMDPGNWATDIAGGSKFGYSLLWVLVMSNIIALLLQSHCVRLGVVTGKDLAQTSRENYPRFINLFLYALAEIAIAACDLAEVIGMAIGLHLLFPGVSILIGVCITVFDSFILLFLLNKGIRKLEAFIISLVLLIGVSFFIQLLIAKPDLADIASGLTPFIANDEALYIAIGIIGATVMPHNLYLHSSLVQTRTFKRTPVDIKKAIRFNTIDSAIALNLALFVNAAILILSAATFFKNGKHDVVEIQDAHQLLAPMLGSALAPILFAVALIAAGQSSTITGTLAGQVVMEGYLNLRLQPWIRRLITRLIAIVPAFITILVLGESATGKLLIFSQVILSLQLGFAIIPLIHFVSDKSKMGDFVIPAWQKTASWVSALVIIVLNINLVYVEISDLLVTSSSPILVSFTIVPFCVFCLIMLVYILVIPFITKERKTADKGFHTEFTPLVLDFETALTKIAVTVDFGTSDNKAINKAIQMSNKDSTLILIHVLESANAMVYGEDAFDHEREEDYQKLLQYQNQLKAMNIKTEIQLGFGNPKVAIPALIIKNNCDTVVMGTHGHKTLKDILLGTTIEGVRHAIKVPLVLV